jgi:hypothetical protein
MAISTANARFFIYVEEKLWDSYGTIGVMVHKRHDHHYVRRTVGQHMENGNT